MYYTTLPRVHGTLYGALLHISNSVHRFKFIFNILHNKFALLNSISFEFALCLYIYSLHFLINIYIIMWIWNWKPWKAYLYAHIKCIWIEQWLYCTLGQNGMIIVRKVDYILRLESREIRIFIMYGEWRLFGEQSSLFNLYTWKKFTEHNSMRFWR